MSNMFNKEMVRLRRLELPRGISPTATSTLRVYQFRHSRTLFCGSGLRLPSYLTNRTWNQEQDHIPLYRYQGLANGGSKSLWVRPYRWPSD